MKIIKDTLKAECYAMKLLFETNVGLGIFYLFFYAIDYPISLANTFIWKYIIDELTCVYKGISNEKRICVLLCLYFGIMLFGLCVKKVNYGVIRPILHTASQKKLDERIMRKMAELDPSFFDDPENYDMIQIAKNSRQEISGAMTFFLRETISAVTFLVSLVAFLSIEPVAGCIYLATNLPSVVIKYKNGIKMDRYSIKSIPENREKNYYRSLLTGKAYAKDLRLYNLKHHWKKRYNDLWEEIRKERFKIFSQGIKLSYISVILSVIGKSFLIGFSVYSIVNGKMTLGTMIMFFSFAEKTNSMFLALVVSIPNHIKITIPHINRFMQFVTYEGTAKSNGNAFTEGLLEIEFRDVCFRYPKCDEDILHHLNLKIEAGKKIMLVGENGAGKTTLIKLLLRFYEPYCGEILINGKNIKDYSRKELYRMFSVCFQDITKYSLTMAENIAISDIERIDDEKEIQKAANAAGVDVISNLFSQGYNADLTRKFNDKGYELSGGQWQKVAISRAFFRNARFLILDEPSSALDPEAEEHVFSSFKKLCKNKGGIVISHRMSSAILADEIVLLKKGKIAEQGTHEELMKLNGEYAYLYNLQARKYMKENG